MSLPLPDRLLTEIAATAVPPSAPVRDVTIRARDGNRVTDGAKLSQVDFLPALSLTLEIERQAQLPDSPLVLRILSMPGIVAGLISRMAAFPPGVTLREQHVFVDVAELMRQRGLGELVPLLDDVQVSTAAGRVQVDLRVKVR